MRKRPINDDLDLITRMQLATAADFGLLDPLDPSITLIQVLELSDDDQPTGRVLAKFGSGPQQYAAAQRFMRSNCRRNPALDMADQVGRRILWEFPAEVSA